MLSKEDNELLTRTGPGTPMGDFFRRFWIPALLSEELAAPDCPPVRVTLMGEKLVAFRDSAGRVGWTILPSPGRESLLRTKRGGRAPLVYHGWKYDVEGRCLDIPNARVGEGFKEKCAARAYPTIEKGGVILGVPRTPGADA